MKWIVLLCVMATAAGCGSEAMYQGKPTSAWMRQLDDHSEAYRVNAMTALGAIGPEAASAAPEIRAIAADRENNSWDTRLKAVETWWKVSRNPNKTVLPQLIAWVREPDEFDAQFAAEAIKRIGPPARGALPALQARDQALAGRASTTQQSGGPSALRKSLMEAIGVLTAGT